MISVFFIQLPPPRFAFQDAPVNIPLAAGFLVSAVDSAGPRGIVTEILEPEIGDVLGDRALVSRVVERRPAVVAMSLYVWNVERSLFLAANIKRALPGTKVIVGGPEVTPDNGWVLRHPAVDAGVFGEGESRIVALLQAIGSQRDLSRIPGTFFKDGREPILNLTPAGQWNLASAPYPYLDGKILPALDGTIFLETVRGCPFQCRYCYYHKAYRTMRFHPEASIENVLDFAYSNHSPVREIYLMDPTFNAHSQFRKVLRSLARRGTGKSVRIHTELRADLLTPDDVLLLQDAGLVSAEVGLQSVNPQALRRAGRTGDPEKVARGVGLLKDAGIDVTTGIILGLPDDTPRGFADTVSWLKRTDAYSVVHPFVLSILPGTDFRASAGHLGLAYDSRPPYYVRSTPTFPEDAFRPALLECERVFDMELDYIAPPSLVDSGPMVTRDPTGLRYVSKWIVDLSSADWQQVLPQVISKASDPFTVWFRGCCDESAILTVLREFAATNPHAVLHVVLEFPELPAVKFLEKALETAAHPAHFLNRSYRPLYAEGEVVTVNFWIIRQDPGNEHSKRLIAEEYRHLAPIVWEIHDPDETRLLDSETPMLLSFPVSDRRLGEKEVLETTKTLHGSHWEEVLFRDSVLDAAWYRLSRDVEVPSRFTETILLR